MKVPKKCKVIGGAAKQMSAQHIEENVLDRYAMGTVSVESIPMIEEHLLGCSVCQSRLVEADQFLTHFRAAATQLDVRPAPLWKRFANSQRLIWGSSAVVAAALALFLTTGEPRRSTSQPATVVLQSLRGPEAQAEVTGGRPGLLVFDVPIAPGRTDFQVEIVDTGGNQILKGKGQVKEEHLTFRIEKLPPAAYWVRVYTGQPERELVAEYGLRAK